MKKKTTETSSGSGTARLTRASSAARPAARSRARRTSTASSAVETRTSVPSQQEIAEAAYYRFLERGGSPGFDFDDWIAAERSLLERAAR
jgi:hypothetical protein